jgi:glycosyltransferase involved in cell wall biosynthesis
MKIHFDNTNVQAKTGPNTFASRLARALFEAGHIVQFDCQGADLSLVFIEPSGAPLAKKVVQRLDGIWFKPNEFHTKNRNIENLYRKADFVIWQSDFDRSMILKWWGIPGRGNGRVIHNGIDTTPVEKITIPELAKIRQSYDQVFVCSSNWHPQKRLKANLQLFDHLRKTQVANSCLFVLGNNPDVITTDPHVFYAGSQPFEVYSQIFAVSNWMLHLAWADHCPNVVIESLSQGTPVMCSSIGGTKELVGKFGLILNEQEYNFELADYDNPPNIDVNQVVGLPKKEALQSHADIDIKNVVKHYIDVFQSVLS